MPRHKTAKAGLEKRRRRRAHDAAPLGTAARPPGPLEPLEPFAPADERILSTRDVLARIPVHRATLWDMCRAGTFPAPLRFTPGRKGWRLSTVLAWIDARARGA